MPQGLSMSFLPFKHTRTFLMCFGYTDGWWGTFLDGFTHVAIMEYIDDHFVIGIEPTLIGARTIFRTIPTPQDLPGWTILKVTVSPTRKNRLIIPILQTCATIVQYHACISLGCIKVNTLYNKLSSKGEAWLKGKGIRSVERWA